MSYFEIDFLDVETEKSGDAITLRYDSEQNEYIHIVDGGYLETGEKIISHINEYYGDVNFIQNVIVTHPDRDHVNGLRRVLEHFQIGTLWMHRPWIYAETLIDRFKKYKSIDALERALKEAYPSIEELETIALEKDISIREPFQGSRIGQFTVLAPTKDRYLDLIVDSDKTPEAAKSLFAEALESAQYIFKAASNLVKAGWGDEHFPADGTSRENEMSVVQYANLCGKHILLTGDAGREALAEAIAYGPRAGLQLPGVNYIQVPHHGGRHNVSTEILNELLGPPLPGPPERTTFCAVCSSAKADPDHPRRVVQRAFMHRGAHWAVTEGRDVHAGVGIERKGWTSIPQPEYPSEMED